MQQYQQSVDPAIVTAAKAARGQNNNESQSKSNNAEEGSEAAGEDDEDDTEEEAGENTLIDPGREDGAAAGGHTNLLERGLCFCASCLKRRLGPRSFVRGRVDEEQAAYVVPKGYARFVLREYEAKRGIEELLRQSSATAAAKPAISDVDDLIDWHCAYFAMQGGRSGATAGGSSASGGAGGGAGGSSGELASAPMAELCTLLRNRDGAKVMRLKDPDTGETERVPRTDNSGELEAVIRARVKQQPQQVSDGGTNRNAGAVGSGMLVRLSPSLALAEHESSSESSSSTTAGPPSSVKFALQVSVPPSSYAAMPPANEPAGAYDSTTTSLPESLVSCLDISDEGTYVEDGMIPWGGLVWQLKPRDPLTQMRPYLITAILVKCDPPPPPSGPRGKKRGKVPVRGGAEPAAGLAAKQSLQPQV
jgi:hypothetical protein